MTTVRFKGRGSDGRVAIYTGSDDDPFDSPLSNMSRVLFHSDLNYPRIVDTRSDTLSLTSRSAESYGRQSVDLFAHGMGGTPIVVGYAVLGGGRVPICGSLPIQMTSRGWGRWIALGATATHVRIVDYWYSQNNTGFAAINVPWVVYVTDTVI